MRQVANFDENNYVRWMDYRKHTTWLSIVCAVIAFSAVFINGFNWGLDFTGGTLVEVHFEQPADMDKVRTVLEDNDFSDAIVQRYGTQQDILVRLPPQSDMDSETLAVGLSTVFSEQIDNPMEIKRVEFVGPQVGGELAEQGLLAIFVALLCIQAYVSSRFEWRLAFSAVFGLFQDITMIIGIFAIFQLQVDMTTLAAVLATIGYSLNDSIVVADRVRENIRILRKEDMETVFNISISQTMSRTLITSFTTLSVLITLYLFGGQMLEGFAVGMIVGVVVGTYSSIFTRSTLALALGVRREAMLPQEIDKEGADQDALL